MKRLIWAMESFICALENPSAAMPSVLTPNFFAAGDEVSTTTR